MLNAKLNTDVLAIVSEFLTEYSDVLSFSLVCSTLRSVAIRRLLSMRAVSLKGYLSVRNFHAFLFGDLVSRAPHVRALCIGDFELPPQLADDSEGSPSPLVAIINSCPNLQHVAMCFAKGTTDDESSVIAAIAALKTLRSLEVSGSSENNLNLLHNVSSPLRKLFINSGFIRSPDVLDEFLPRLAPSLEELELVYFRLQWGTLVALDDETPGPDSDSQPPAFRTLAQYPAVRSFSAMTLIGAPVLDRLRHLFPALDGTLSLGSYRINRWPEDAIRTANRRAQEAAPERAWRKLDRVICDARMLYVLALRCPVRMVMIDKGSPETLHYARDALRENPVPRLKLTLEYGHDMLDGVFTPELAAKLTHLTLCLVYDSKDHWGTDRDTDHFAELLWDDLLGTLLAALRPLHNLTHLRVLIYCKVHKPRDSKSGSLSGKLGYSQKFVNAVRGPQFNFAGTTAALVRALPSTQYLFLTTYGSFVEHDQASRSWRSYEQWDVSRAWRIAEDEPGTDPDGAQDGETDLSGRLVELHNDVADTIIRKEELVLSETDECCLFSED